MSTRSGKRLEKVDFKKSHPELYRASREISQLRVARGTFLARDGVGEPGGKAFQEAIGSLFAMAYAAKFSLKAARVVDFAVPALGVPLVGGPEGQA